MSAHEHHWKLTAHLDGCHWYSSNFSCECGAVSGSYDERDPKTDPYSAIWMSGESNCPRCQELLEGAEPKHERFIEEKPDIAGGQAEGRARRDEGMRRAEEHSPTESDRLYEVAVGVARYSAEHDKPFSSDDIWRVANMTVREGRVMGPVMRRLARNGLAVKLNETRPGYRPENHVRPQNLWMGVK